MSRMHQQSRLMAALASVISALAFSAGSAAGQQPGDIPGRCVDPPSTRRSEIGCYLLSNERVDTVPAGPLYWHLYSYPTRAAAESASAVGGGQDVVTGVVIEAFGKVWRFTIAGGRWTPSSGQREGIVGPLPVPTAAAYRVRFMEGAFPPHAGMLTTVHRHSGSEAWFMISGAQCLRTPDSTMVLRVGEGGVVPSGPAMVLTSIGPEIRRSFVLVLHDASQPWLTNTSEWKPTTECPDR